MSESANFKKDEYCRICLLGFGGGTNVPICFVYCGKKIFEHVKSITNVDISKSYSNPSSSSQYICQCCFEECKLVIGFKQKCVQTNLMLQNEAFRKDHVKKELKIELNDEEYKDECNLANVDLELDSIAGRKQEVEVIVETLNVNELIKEETFACKSCKKRFENVMLLESHISECQFKFQCDDCGSFFKSKCKLKMHWKKEHLKNRLFCNRCKRHFKSFKALHNHKNHKSCQDLDEEWVRVEGEDKKRVFSCKKCNYKTSRIAGISGRFMNHIRSHSGAKPFKCSSCKFSFATLAILRIHEAYKHKISTLPSLQCEECGKTLIGKQRLLRHMSLHRSPLQKCSICNKMIKKRGFNRHMLRHKDVKSFVCEICAVSYYTLSELCTHRRRAHTTNQKVTHSCDVCGYVSYNKYVIQSHMEKHSKSSHACGICGKFLNNELRLAKHKLYHERGRIYKCDYCDHSYFTSKAKSHHVNKKHSNIHIVQNVSRKPLMPSSSNKSPLK